MQREELYILIFSQKLINEEEVTFRNSSARQVSKMMIDESSFKYTMDMGMGPLQNAPEQLPGSHIPPTVAKREGEMVRASATTTSSCSYYPVASSPLSPSFLGERKRGSTDRDSRLPRWRPDHSAA